MIAFCGYPVAARKQQTDGHRKMPVFFAYMFDARDKGVVFAVAMTNNQRSPVFCMKVWA